MNGLFIFNYLHYVKNAYLGNYFFAGLCSPRSLHIILSEFMENYCMIVLVSNAFVI